MIKQKFLLLSCALVLLLTPTNAQEKLYKNEFPIADVKLLDGVFKHARELNIEVLLKYDVDRLLAPYRKEAGLTERKPIPTGMVLTAMWQGITFRLCQ